MNQVYTIRPADGWQVGDRVYCVRGARETMPPIEAGKVYQVSEVVPVPGHVDDGINLAGVQPPNGTRGFWSGRFVKLRKGGRHIDQIDAQTSRSWREAYVASTKRNPANG